jgi:hypothetical protein
MILASRFAGLVMMTGLAAVSLPVAAATAIFPTEPAAAQVCGADEVVWVDLDRGKFYHKAQTAYAKGNNGGYACMKSAHAQYREAHE